MGNIDNLNFTLLLNDKDFDKKIQKNLQAVKDLNKELAKSGRSTNMSTYISEQKKLNKELEKTLKLQKQMGNIRAQGQATRGATQAAIQQERLNREMLKTQKLQQSINKHQGASLPIMKQLLAYAGTYVSVLGSVQFLNNVIRTTGEFQAQQIALRTIIGDVDKADALFARIKDYAVNFSPFSVMNLTSFTKQLSAYSIETSKLFETTKMLADVSAGLGVDMGRITLAYGQIKTASFLRGQEVRQLTEAGIPILTELAKQFEATTGHVVTAAQVFDKISARQVPFEMVEQVFKNMTSEGGKFYNMQEQLSQSLKGQVQKLGDAFTVMFDEIGENSTLIPNTIEGIKKLVINYEKVGTILKTLIIAYGAYKATMIAVAAIEKVVSTMALIDRARKLGVQVNVLTLAVRGLGITAKAAFGLAAAAIAAVVTVIVSATRNAHALDRELKNIISEKITSSSDLVRGFEDLADRLSKATQGSQEYRDIVAQLNRQYGDYLPNVLHEADAINEVAAARRNVVDAINAEAQASARARGMEAIDADFNKEYAKNIKNFETLTLAGIKNLSDKRQFETFLREYVYNILNAGGSIDNALDVYKGAYQSYFGYLTEVPAYAYAEKMVELFADRFEQVRNLEDMIAASYGSKQYDTAEEARIISEIEDRYEREADAIYTNGDAEKYEADMRDLNIRKLNEEIAAYEELGRTKKANELKDELAVLEHTVGGWREIIGGYFSEQNKDMRPVEADEERAYIEKMRKEYKNLSQDVADATSVYKKFTEEQKKGAAITEQDIATAKDLVDMLTNRKAGIEAAAKFFGIGLDTKNLIGDDDKEGIKPFNLNKFYVGKAKGYIDEEMTTLQMYLDAVRQIAVEYNKAADAKKKFAHINEDSENLVKMREVLEDVSKKEEDLTDDDGKKTKRLKRIFKEMGKIGESISSINEDMGMTVETIASFGEALIDSKDAKASWLEVWIKTAETVIDKGIEIIKAEQEAGQRAIDAYRKYQSSIFGDKLTANTESVFGTNKAEEFRNSLNGIAEANDKLRQSLSVSVPTPRYIEILDRLSELREQERKLMFADGRISQADTVRREIAALEEELRNLDTAALAYFESVAKARGISLYKDNGEFDIAGFKALQEGGVGGFENALKDIISAIENLTTASEQCEGVMKDMFESMASDAADAIIDRWIEAGDAAADYADILGNVEEAYAKLLLQDYLLKNVFTDERKQALFDAMANEDTAEFDRQMQLLENDLQAIQNNAVVAKLKDLSYLGGEEANNTLASGIQSVTEETAGLLASYVNAIRADVAYGREQREEMLSIMRVMGGMGEPSPTLTNYLNAIQADMHDVALSNREMLSRMDSMMTYDGGNGAALRIYNR